MRKVAVHDLEQLHSRHSRTANRDGLGWSASHPESGREAVIKYSINNVDTGKRLSGMIDMVQQHAFEFHPLTGQMATDSRLERSSVQAVENRAGEE